MRANPSGNTSSDNGVIRTRASSGEGIHWLIRRGVVNTTSRVTRPTIRAAGFGSKPRITICSDCSTPPLLLIPSKGPICRVRMITPIPDMKPDTTE